MAVDKGDVMACIASARLQAQEQAMLTDKIHNTTNNKPRTFSDDDIAALEQAVGMSTLEQCKALTGHKPQLKLDRTGTDE